MAWLNLFLLVLEFLTLSVCQYEFLSHNERAIYLKKGWYFLLFFVDYAALFAATTLTGADGRTPAAVGNLLSILVIIFGVPVMGAIGFHRRAKALVLDGLYGVFLLLTIQGGILAAMWLSVRLEFSSILLYGNLAMFLKCLLLIIGTRLLTFFMGKKLKGRLSGKQLLSILILPGFSLFYITSLTEISGVYLQLYGMELLTANIAAVLLMNVYFFYLLSHLIRSRRLEEQLVLYQRENELRYHYYEELDRKYRESRKVIHDMKNHLQAVEDLYAGQKTEAGDRYVKDLYHMLNVLGEKRYTENQMLNIILNEKIREAEAKGITVTVRVGDIDLSDIKEIDLTTIFANLLDNAIEAAGEDGRLSIDNQSGVSNSGEIILNVSDEETYILDAVSGLPIKLEDIKDGDTIYAYIGPAMTMSLPPMTNADVIFANIPADAKVPDYVEVKSMITDASTSKSVLTALDGTEYTLADDCNIFPYLTRNIVTLDDLTQGRKCVVWADDENSASKIMVFAE
mgnify:CR=1 FL=1